VRKIVSGFFIATLLLATQACASVPSAQTATPTDTNSFAYLAAWVGRGPAAVSVADDFNHIPAHGNLWDDPKIMASLKKAMGKDRVQQMITGWGGGRVLDHAIERVSDGHGGDFIAFFACKQHDCLPHGAYVFINLVDGAVQACWVEESQASKARSDNFETSEIWLSSLGERKLADGDCSGSGVTAAKMISQYGDGAVIKNKKVN